MPTEISCGYLPLLKQCSLTLSINYFVTQPCPYNTPINSVHPRLAEPRSKATAPLPHQFHGQAAGRERRCFQSTSAKQGACTCLAGTGPVDRGVLATSTISGSSWVHRMGGCGGAAATRWISRRRCALRRAQSASSSARPQEETLTRLHSSRAAGLAGAGRLLSGKLTMIVSTCSEGWAAMHFHATHSTR